jgi:hypothetical protein
MHYTHSDEFLFVLLLMCGFWTVALLIGYNFLSSLGAAVRRVTPENRRISPGWVWLNLVPVLNFVWLPVTIDRIADSLHNEFYTRGLDARGEGFGRPMGFAWLGLVPFAVLSHDLTEWFRDSSPIAALAWWLSAGTGFASFFCWVGYWIQVSNYNRRLKNRTYAPPATDPW